MKVEIVLGPLCLCAGLAAAQRYTYTTKTVTECFSTTPTSLGPPAPTSGSDGYWTISMPECENCGCPGCEHTHEYTATFSVLAPHGLAPWEYPIREVYRGMSKMPVVAVPTEMPYAFTTSVETCRICGDEPLTATMTFPRGAHPYQQDAPRATEPPNTAVAASSPTHPSTLQTQVSAQTPSLLPTVADKDTAQRPSPLPTVPDKDTAHNQDKSEPETKEDAKKAFFIRGSTRPEHNGSRPVEERDHQTLLEVSAVQRHAGATSSAENELPQPTQRWQPRAEDVHALVKRDSRARLVGLGAWLAVTIPLTLMV